MREMKDSGIEWIGEIPVGWEIIKLKMAYVSSNAGEVIDKSFWNSGNELLYTCQKTPMMSNFMDFPFNKRTTDDDLLLTRNATPYIFIPEGNAIYSNVVQRITISSKYERRFVRYALQCGIEALTVQGDTIPSYNMQVWNNVYIPNIPRPQQHRISTYLDTKCEKIDSIIARQQEVIEKLKAYKLSKINEIVTEVSGVECHLGRISSMKNGLNFNIATDGNKIKFLGVGDFKDYFTLDDKEMFSEIIVNEEIPDEYLLESGDIIFVRSNGSKELVGRAVMVENIDFALTYSGFCIRFRNVRTDLVDDKYLLYFFRSPYFRKQLEKYSQGSNISNINQVLLSQISIIIPSLDYQIEALKKLDKLSISIDSAIAKKQAIIEKLTAYKKSLIYEVVTGKREV